MSRRTGMRIRVALLPILFLNSCAPAVSESRPHPIGGGAEVESATERHDSASVPFTLHFLDVGQGDAVLLKSPGGQNLLYDGGPGQSAALAHLQRLGVETLDLVIASHAHADHIGGLVEVIRHYRPRFFMDNGMPHTTQTYRRLLEAVEEAGSQLIEPTARRIALGEVEVHVLPPPEGKAWSQNDHSVGLLLVHGEFRATLTGDAERRQWEWWLEHHPQRIAAVHLHKASHHGSRNGDIAAALHHLRPQLVVVSAGAENRYGHPHPEILALYAAAGARVLRTDEAGTVTVEAFRDGFFRIRGAAGAAAEATLETGR